MSYGIKGVITDVLNLDLQIAAEELQKARFKICEECPQYNPTTKLCNQCGCYMPVKTKLIKAICPLKKW